MQEKNRSAMVYLKLGDSFPKVGSGVKKNKKAFTNGTDSNLQSLHYRYRLLSPDLITGKSAEAAAAEGLLKIDIPSHGYGLPQQM